jgi:tetratricopeptide (TPR) repeat protein
MTVTRTRRRVVVDDRPLARTIGARLRQARLAAGLTQQQLAGDRYTKAYISALENGIAKPSMAALNYLAPRLGTTASEILADPNSAWARVEVDLAMASGDWSTALAGYTVLLEAASERRTRADCLLAIAECLCRLDRPAEAIRPATEAAALYTELGRLAERTLAEYWLSSAHAQEDNSDESRALLHGVLERVRGGVDLGPDFKTKVLIALASLEAGDEQPSRALAYAEEARGLVADLDTRRRGVFLSALATAYRNAGDLEAAIRTGQQALALLRAAESELDVGHVENHLALAFAANGNLAKARSTIRHARQAAHANPRLDALMADTEATVELDAGNADKALALAEEAIDLSRRAEHSKALLDALATRARALSALGRNEEAAASFAEAAELAEKLGPASRRRQILSSWADTLAALGRHDEAYALARRALASR